MSKKVGIGLASIKLGAIATDGGMATALAPLGQTAEDTCKIEFGDAEETPFYVEEQDAPIYIERKQGDIDISFSIYEYDLETIKEVFGGEITGSGGNKVYKAPATAVNIEKSLEITPKKGHILSFPRVSITAKFSADIGKKNLMALEIKAKVLQPTKEGEPRFTMKPLA